MSIRIIALVEGLDHVCCRYRLRAFEQMLKDSGSAIVYRKVRRGAGLRTLQFIGLQNFDAVVLQRRLLPVWQLSLLRRMANHLVFDFDDAVLYRDSYHVRGLFSRKRARRFAATVRAADVTVAGNEFLGNCAIRAGASRERVTILPTCIDPDRYPAVSRITHDSGLQLVWIGSASTLQGLNRERRLWERLGRDLTSLKLRVICDAFPDFQALPVVPIQWNESTEALDLAGADIGISWIPDDLWSRGKCGLKILQYHASRLPVVTNPVGVHAAMVHHGVSGFLATTPEEWVEAIRTLGSDAFLRRRMGEAGRANVEAHYSVGIWGSRFVDVMKGTLPSRESGATFSVPRL